MSVQVASVTNAEHAMMPVAAAMRGVRICQITATATRKPSTPLPTSPMNTRARGKLNGTMKHGRGPECQLPGRRDIVGAYSAASVQNTKIDPQRKDAVDATFSNGIVELIYETVATPQHRPATAGRNVRAVGHDDSARQTAAGGTTNVQRGSAMHRKALAGEVRRDRRSSRRARCRRCPE